MKALEYKTITTTCMILTYYNIEAWERPGDEGACSYVWANQNLKN